MKRKTPIVLLIGWIAVALAPTQTANAAEESAASNTVQQTAVISGQVSNATAETYLQGAVVELVGTNQSVTTDREGRYQFNGVPGGVATLAVSYPGLDAQQVSVAAQGGQTIVRNVALSSEYYRLEAFNVTEAREGSARAIAEQKNASNIKSVVATDSFGNLRDGNVAELLSRLPGLSVLYSSNDIRNVMVRGIDSSLGLTTIDGNQLANAESAGMSRSFQWDQSSVDQIETVEVERTPTPDKDAAAIGGTVNLVTKSAFDSVGNRRINVSLGGSYDDVYRLYLPQANFSYSEIVGKNKTIGISFNASYSEHNNLSLGSTLAHVTTAPTPSPLVRAQIADYPNIRWRMSAGLKLDFKLDQATTAFVNFLYNGWREGIDAPSTYRYVVAQTAANGSNVLPVFTDDYAEWRPATTTFARILVGQSRMALKFSSGGGNGCHDGFGGSRGEAG